MRTAAAARGRRRGARDRRRRLHRHEPRAPAAARRAGACSSSTTSRGPASSATCAGCTRPHGSRVQVEVARRAAARGRRAAPCARRPQVFHLAAQVAVTTSLADPRDDFEMNARGHAEPARGDAGAGRPPSLVFTSTNKVYGACDDVPLVEGATRYEPRDRRLRATGIDEARPLDFHSPYGCSKGAADQYVLDYARTFGLPTVVFRMSCIYGPHQFGTEDQGWVAHFADPRDRRRADHALRRRQAGARRALRRGPRRTLIAAAGARRRSSPARRSTSAAGPANTDQPARAARAASRAARRAAAGAPRELAHGRPAPLRLGHPQAAGGDGLAPARRRARRAWGGSTTGCVESRARAPRDSAEPMRDGAPPAGVALAARRRDGAAASEGSMGVPCQRTACGRAGDRGAPARAGCDEVPLPDAGPGEVRVRLEGCGVCALEPRARGKGSRGRSTRSTPARPATRAGALSTPRRATSARCARATASRSSRRAPTREYDIARGRVRRRASRASSPASPSPARRSAARSTCSGAATCARARRWRSSASASSGALLDAARGARRRAGDRALAAAVRARPRPALRAPPRRSPTADGAAAVERVRELTGGQGCERVIEAVGRQSTLDLAAELTARARPARRSRATTRTGRGR